MTEAEKRMRRVCFTGHRPEKLTRFEWLVKRELEKKSARQLLTDLRSLLQEWPGGLTFGRQKSY